MTEIDLSKNNLSKLDGCSMLQCAKTLVVDDNKLVTVVKRGTLNLPYLETLSLNNNSILCRSLLRTICTRKNLNLTTRSSVRNRLVPSLCYKL